MTTYNRNEIEEVPIVRVSTGFRELDWLYGSTGSDWGVPLRAISLWAGESGTGKSRTAVAICNSLAHNGHRILYFQNEMHLGQFCKKIKYDSFRVSDSVHLADMVNDIKSDRPSFVVVDSVNMIKEFSNGTKKDVERILEPFITYSINNPCHIILLGQLNQDGTIKGSSTLPHLVDIALDLKKGNEGLFSISVGIKNRYGRTGSAYKTVWQHVDDGVLPVSNSRFYDDAWNLDGGAVESAKRKRFSFFRKK